MSLVDWLEIITIVGIIWRVIRKVKNMKQLFKTAIGAEGSVEADLNDDGTAEIKASYVHQGLEVDLVVKGSPKAALDGLKYLIPGDIDNMVIDALEGVLGLK